MNEKALALTVTGLLVVMMAISGGSFFMAKLAMDKAASLETKLGSENEANSKMLGRLEELDAGMVALTKLSNVDPDELGKVMLSELMEIRGLKASLSEAQAQSSTSTVMEPEPLSVELAAPSEPPAGSSVPVTETTSHSAKLVENAPAPGVKQDFESIVKNLQAVAPTAAPSATSQAEKRKPLTIADVDGVLARLISDQWHKPPGAADGMKAEIHIKMSRDGKIEKADVTRGSGLDAFDLSAVTALRSIGVVKEVAQLDDATYEKAYRSRTILLK